MVLLLVLVVSLAAGSGAFSAIRHRPQADPALTATRAIGTDLRSHGGSRRFLRSRMDPATVPTGIRVEMLVSVTARTSPGTGPDADGKKT